MLARLGRRGDLADLLDQLLPQVERRGQHLAEALRAPEAGDEVEQVGDVGGDIGIGGEQADVLVGSRSRCVVVPRADVHVAPKLVALAAHDQRRLRVDLHVREAVDDVDARLFERARPADVPPLVEARLQLDDADGLLALLRRLDQCGCDRRVLARAIDRRLQCDHVIVAGGGADERLDARSERVVRVVDDDVSARDLGEELVGVLVAQPPLGERHPWRVLQIGAVERVEL